MLAPLVREVADQRLRESLIRVALGDYSDDKYAARFPKFEGNDSGETPQQLFEAWVAERKRVAGAAIRTNAASLPPTEIGSWRVAVRSLSSLGQAVP